MSGECRDGTRVDPLTRECLRSEPTPSHSRAERLLSLADSAAATPLRSLVALCLAVSCLVFAGCGTAQKKAEPAPGCDETKMTEVIEPASVAQPDVVVDCNLTLASTTVITKRLRVQGSQGSGVTIDCNGATIDGAGIPALSDENAKEDMIVVESLSTGDPNNSTWNRPTDVAIRNCVVIGSVRILGMQDIEDIKKSSYSAGHAARMRAIAPTRIVFDGLTITARARTPVFFGVGVTESTLINSELNGEAEAAAIYLDAESSRNIIKNNYIHTWSPREVLSIDASEGNVIIDNYFSALSNGGIYLYRNCGERKVVRHTTPNHNTIVNNVFYYNHYSPNLFSVNPSVFLGSRNGSPGFCDEDDGHPLGSGASNLDYAQRNVVMQNQIYKLSVGLMIRQGRSTDSPNYVGYNTTVTSHVTRLAGCYVDGGYYTGSAQSLVDT